MTEEQRIAFRAARSIHQQLSARRSHRFPIELPSETWAECLRITQLIEIAQQRGWWAAARELEERFHPLLAYVETRIETAVRELGSGSGRPEQPLKLRQVYEEILAVFDEFEHAEIDLQKRTLSVETDYIRLEDVTLGRFEIRLAWNRLSEHRPYDVVALDPNPAGSSSDTTHPHVRDEQLCEGEGRLPIQQALRDGRLSDFFLIVSQVLGSYNAGSAFVALDDWSGRPCRDCGDAVSDDDSCDCTGCHAVVCTSCVTCCAVCDDSRCSQCVSTCDGCDASCCGRCRSLCDQCQGDFCDDCLSDGLCEDCREAAAESDGAGDSQPGGAAAAEQAAAEAHPASAAVLADRLGQAPVPA